MLNDVGGDGNRTILYAKNIGAMAIAPYDE